MMLIHITSYIPVYILKYYFFAAADTAVTLPAWHSLKIADPSGAEVLFSHLLLSLIF